MRAIDCLVGALAAAAATARGGGVVVVLWVGHLGHSLGWGYP